MKNGMQFYRNKKLFNRLIVRNLFYILVSDKGGPPHTFIFILLISIKFYIFFFMMLH